MIDLPYSLIIEATDDPDFFSFYSDELQGFTGVGHSIEDCLYRARHGMRDHVETMRERRLKVPKANGNPKVVIVNAAARRRSA
jgi:predicted RNase H-like HicB family nuclease